MAFQLKTYPEDFYVVEAMVQSYAQNDKGPFHYYLLIKRNISTFEAVRRISLENHLEVRQIGYAGLKDEDGVTTQTISSPVKLLTDYAQGVMQHQFMRLCYLGSGHSAVQIGMLSGNSFRLIIRGISTELTTLFSQKKKITDFFINYYGPQRFGLPHETKTTHLIGEFLHQKQYDQAIHLLAKQNSTLGLAARQHQYDAAQFFKNIDERQLAFILNSYESFKWNQQVKQIVYMTELGKYDVMNNEGMEYYYLQERRSLIKLLNRYPILPYEKVFYQNNRIEQVLQERSVVIPVDMICHQTFIDEKHLMCCELSFYLPSGCYATMAVDQVLNHLQLTYNLSHVSEVHEVIAH